MIREADISRLSFAVELAEEFYGRDKMWHLKEQNFCGLYNVTFYHLFWAVTEGKSVKEMVDEPLRHVPNSEVNASCFAGDKNLDQILKPLVNSRNVVCDSSDSELMLTSILSALKGRKRETTKGKKRDVDEVKL
ncbi:hypothetical protein L2E82_30790 [Cichorium intybus]|uniref:Uncharacterized protein n=1 Tax=Cichorium intybus TaxID=13427 RepID=A0ACB9D186_CICIN|nr:hypothetical protein L2E82_30790 [Cichorium intybus]